MQYIINSKVSFYFVWVLKYFGLTNSIYRRHEDKLFVDILTMLLSRARPTQIQLVAAKCLSYMQRADAIKETDERIVYYAIPCLARLCIPEYDDETRTIAADTLAYLTEVGNINICYY